MRIASGRRWILESQMGTELKRTVDATVSRFRLGYRPLYPRTAGDGLWEQQKFTSRLLSSWDREQVRDYSSM